MNVCLFVKKNLKIFKRQGEMVVYQTRHKTNLHQAACKSMFYRKNIAYNMAPKIYNRLPKNINSIQIYNIFKRKLNDWLLEKCFYSINDFLQQY